MTETWAYQIRVHLTDDAARQARSDPGATALRPLRDVLVRHKAALKCQYDAFAGYVAEAEGQGVDAYPLYKWTKATIEDPQKKDKYLKVFTLYVEDAEVYAKDRADALESELAPMVGGALITRLTKHDTNPANNPQVPQAYR